MPQLEIPQKQMYNTTATEIATETSLSTINHHHHQHEQWGVTIGCDVHVVGILSVTTYLAAPELHLNT
jgi:hypothetical protein